MQSTFTKRPVTSVVVAIVITLLGLLSLRSLPMALFPSVAPPEVNVTVEYTGANAEVVTKAAIVPLERAINGVPGMKYMSSDTGNDGVGVVQVLFETGTDPDVAAVNVQNRVNSVIGELPAEVIRNGVKIAKEENAMLMYLSIFSTDDRLDEKFLYNFADINVLAELKRIPGVGYADILGAKEYAMRIWLKPEKLVAYHVTPEDVLEALQKSNLEAAPGKLGENSDKGNTALQYTVKYTGKFTTPEQYGNIPVRSSANGDILRVRDVADVELGTTYFDVEAKFNGRPAASIMLKQLPGSNASQVIAAVKKRMAELKADAFLPGMDYAFSFDVSRFLDAAVREVVKTLLEAFLLVVLVVFLFLQDPGARGPRVPHWNAGSPLCAGILAQPRHPLRPGPRHRHRRGRRHRGGRGSAREARAHGAGSPRSHGRSDGRNRWSHRRHHARHGLGVHPARVHVGAVGHLLQAVRLDDGSGHRPVWRGRPDADPCAVRHLPEAA